MAQKLTYSTVLYDLTWQDIADAENELSKVQSSDNVDMRVTYDTSGGKLEDGTTYNTESTFRIKYKYPLGEGDVAANRLANAMTVFPLGPDKSQSEYRNEIVSRA